MSNLLFKVLRQILADQVRMLESLSATDITRADTCDLIKEIDDAVGGNDVVDESNAALQAEAEQHREWKEEQEVQQSIDEQKQEEANEMTKHAVGNHYKFLGHILELVEMVKCGFGVVRYKLNCQVHGGCCTVPNGIRMECLIDELNTMNCIKEVDRRYHPPEKSRVDWKAGDIAVIKDQWEGAGQKLQVLGPAVFLEQWWVPVEDSEDDDPTFHKEAGLEKVQ